MAVGSGRYDRRVAALVEVRGGAHDWAEAERRFEAHGWPVRGHRPRGAGPTRGVLDDNPDSRVYDVEIRLPGAARGCERGAAYRLAKAMKAARIEAYVLRVEAIVRDREAGSRWQVYGTAHRSRSPMPRWRRRVVRWVERLHHYDTGIQVFGGPRQALRLARADPAHGYDATARVAVRPLDERWRHPERYWGEEEGDRRLYAMAMWALGTAISAVFAFGCAGFARWFWSLATVLALLTTLSRGRRLYRTPSLEGAVIALVAVATVTAILLRPGSDDWAANARREAVIFLALLVVSAGLWLLVRQWTWGEWAAWVIPLLITLGTSTFLTTGSLLHALYADSLGLSPDDISVPSIWQLVATLKLLELLSLVMAVPAAWGYARHFHYARATPGEGFNGLLYVLLLIVLLGGSAGLALNSAQAAADRTTAAARQGLPPPPYFGIDPEWVCVEPVLPMAQLASQGPRLDPRSPYLSFGTTGDNAILWDRRAQKPVKIPASQVRLVPVQTATQRCSGVVR